MFFIFPFPHQNQLRHVADFEKVRSRSFRICFKQLYRCAFPSWRMEATRPRLPNNFLSARREKNIIAAFYFIGPNALLRLGYESFHLWNSFLLRTTYVLVYKSTSGGLPPNFSQVFHSLDARECILKQTFQVPRRFSSNWQLSWSTCCTYL